MSVCSYASDGRLLLSTTRGVKKPPHARATCERSRPGPGMAIATIPASAAAMNRGFMVQLYPRLTQSSRR
jgi:hypothetical protein